jgi:hypothetical protein
VRIENMLWIEYIVKSTPTPPFFINIKVGMTGFVELEGRAKKLKVGTTIFKMKRDLNLQIF